MKIGILTYHPTSSSFRRLSSIAKARGHDVRFIHISHCYMGISSTLPSIYYRGNEIYEGLEAVIPRISPIHTFYGTSVLRQLETLGVYSLNSANAISISRDKLRSFQLLAAKHLSFPTTGFADSPDETEKLIEMVGGAPLIIRLLEGSEGQNTIFAETQQAAISVINAFKQLKTKMFVQEYIKESNGKDIRCVVVGNQVITAVQRTSVPRATVEQKKEFLAAVDISPQERKLAVQAVKALDLHFASVDFIRSDRGPLIIDIDCSPRTEMLEKISGVDITTPIIEFLEQAKNPK